MKKKLLVFLLILLVVVAVGCDYGWIYLDSNEISSADRIVLVWYENDNPIEFKLTDATTPAFDFDKITFIKELNPERFDAFAQDISKVMQEKSGEIANEPVGYTVLIYKGEKIIVLSCTIVKQYKRGYAFSAVFTQDGEFLRYIGTCNDEPLFRQIILDHFGVDTQIN